ncbi:MAG: hypothetical protein U1A77_08655 [Pirellulales bacterium]
MNRRKGGLNFADNGFSGQVTVPNPTSTIGDHYYGAIIVCDEGNTVFAPITIRFGGSDCLDISHVAVMREPDNDYANPVAASELPSQKPMFGNSGSACCYPPRR